MEALALYSGQAMRIALSPVRTVMALLTLAVAAINLHDGDRGLGT